MVFHISIICRKLLEFLYKPTEKLHKTIIQFKPKTVQILLFHIELLKKVVLCYFWVIISKKKPLSPRKIESEDHLKTLLSASWKKLRVVFNLIYKR